MELIKYKSIVYYNDKTCNDFQISDNFTFNEFKCKCGHCPITLIDPLLVEALAALRKAYNKPIYVNSAFRCYIHNNSIGGKVNSQHLAGRAVDIQLDTQLLALAPKYFNFVLEEVSWIHLDIYKRS